MRRAVAATVLACALAAPTTVRAQSAQVAAGRAAFERASFAQAARVFERVLTDPSATRADLVEAYRYLATIRLALGDRATAAVQTVVALALAPDAAPPEGASPEAVALFDRTRRDRHGARARVALHLPAPLRPVARGAIEITVADLPDVLASARLDVRCTNDQSSLAQLEARATNNTLAVALPPLPRGAAVRCRAALLSSAGVTLDEAHVDTLVGGPDAATTARGASLTGIVPPPTGDAAGAANASAILGSAAGSSRDVTPPLQRRRGPPVGWIVLGSVGGAAVLTGIIVLAVVLARPTTAQLGNVTFETGAGP